MKTEFPDARASENITEGCIVLEGGAFRGTYTEGVLDALMLSDINLRCTIGVSAGAMNGLNYVSGQIGRSVRFNMKYRHDRRYMGPRAIIRDHGLVGFDFLYREYDMIDPLDRDRMDNYGKRFIAVATSVESGEPVYFENGHCSNILRAVSASASMPFFSMPVDVDGIPCLDGGCSVNIPYRWALKNHYKKIVIVRTRTEDYRKKESKSLRPMTIALYRPHEQFVKQMIHKIKRYNRECEEILALKESGRAFVIAPTVDLGVQRLEGNLEKLEKLYWLGYNDTMDKLEALKEYLEI